MLNRILSSQIEKTLGQYSVKSLSDQNLVIEIALIERPEDELCRYELKARLFSVDKDERKWHKSIKEYLAGARIVGNSPKEIGDRLETW